MFFPRFYCADLDGKAVRLDENQSRHLAQVLRLGPSDQVELFDGRGGVGRGRILRADKRDVQVEILDRWEIGPRQSGRLILVVSVAKGKRLDWLIGKATELDVDHIVPVHCERTVKQVVNPDILERWHGILVASSQQCRRAFLPKIELPGAFPDTLDRLGKEYPGASIFFGSSDPDTPSVLDVVCPVESDGIIVIGPEGGLTDGEESAMRERGGKPSRLGDTVLRVETAAAAFAAVWQVLRDRAGRV